MDDVAALAASVVTPWFAERDAELARLG